MSSCTVKQQKNSAWTACFAGEGKSVHRSFRTINRAGHTFFYLPDSRQEASTLLNAYQPQRGFAKLVSRLLRLAIRLGGLPLFPREVAPIRRSSAFGEFLQKISGTTEIPLFGVLQGNPNTPGMRINFFLTDSSNVPALAIKAGWTQESRALIAREVAALHQMGGSVQGVPPCLAEFEHDQVKAFAMQYIVGISPRSDDMQGVATILNGWIHDAGPIMLGRIPAWQRLMEDGEFSANKDFQELSKHQITPVIFHGDFAPWNIRVPASGSWQVIDWERGEELGVPGWDWFHYIVQSAILIRREKPAIIKRRIEAVIASPEFRNYATRTGIRGHERIIFRCYLIHALNLRQSEGFPILEALANQFRRFKDSPHG